MTSVRIMVDHPFLGDIDVTEDDQVGSYDSDRERAVIDALLERALGKIRRAYEIQHQENA